MLASILMLTQRGRYFTDKETETWRDLSNLPKVTQPVCIGAGISIQVPCLPRSLHSI